MPGILLCSLLVTQERIHHAQKSMQSLAIRVPGETVFTFHCMFDFFFFKHQAHAILWPTFLRASLCSPTSLECAILLPQLLGAGVFASGPADTCSYLY